MPPELRRDVRLLTTMLGEAIAESGGPSLLDDVEALRRAAIALRGRPTPARRRAVVELVASFDLARAEQVVRAFTCYFQLVNLAEERQRIRVLRGRSHGPRPLEGSVAALGPLAEPAAFEDLLIRPVLTAHPTEAKRRAVVEHVWRIADQLDRVRDERMGEAETAESMRRLREEIGGLWRTDPVRQHRPEPLDEVRATLALFDQTIFTTLPLVYREVDRAIDPDRSGAREPAFGAFLRWGTWVGGDRDGNPSVTAETTAAATAIATDHVLRGLENAARRIARSLSVSDRDVPASPALRRALARDERTLPGAARELARKLPDAPHRRKLGLAAHRLAATRGRGRGALRRPVGVRGRSRGVAAIARRRRRAHPRLGRAAAPAVAGGDVRIPSGRDGGAPTRRRLRRRPARARPGRGRRRPRARPARETAMEGAAPAATSAESREVLATFRTIRDVQDRLGTSACERVIVSFTRTAADLAGVRALARLASPARPADVRPVPLLESRHELATAREILDAWIALPGTKQELRRRRRELQVMVGYSDSAEGGRRARRRTSSSTARSDRWRRGPRATTSGSRSSTGAAGRSAAAAGRPRARSSASRRARSTAASRSPSRARWPSPATGTRCWLAGTSSSSRARCVRASAAGDDRTRRRSSTRSTSWARRPDAAYETLVHERRVRRGSSGG